MEAAVREELGDDAFFVPPPIMGGEDFSAYLKRRAGRVLHRRRGRERPLPAPPSALRLGRERDAQRHCCLHAACSRLPEVNAAGRAAHRLGRNRRDGDAARDGARGAVPRADVRGDPASAGRDGRGPPARRRARQGTAGGRRLHDRRSRSCARRCGVLCRRAKVHYCDILGPPMASIAKVSGQGAQMKAGARPPLNSAYFKRMAAIEFAVKYDDGLGAKGLREADIVLVGVSRTSKTPVSMFLGSMGYKTANVPIVKGIAPPDELFEIEPGQDRRADDRRRAARRHPPRARAAHAGEQAAVRRPRRGLRGACTRRRRSTGGSAAP